MTRSYWHGFEDTAEDQERESDREAVVAAFAGRVAASGNWMRVDCTLCEAKTGKADRKQSLGYNPETGGFNCFKCGTRGRLTEAQRDELPRLEGNPEAEALPGKPTDVEPCWGYTPVFAEPGATADVFADARAYVLSRGITAEVAAWAGVGSASWGKNAGRILVPLPDYAAPNSIAYPGSWMGWVGRGYRLLPPLPDGRPAPLYRYAARFLREGYLYNAPALAEETDVPVLVVEGTLDVLFLQAHGLDAVALLGKASAVQKQLLAAAHRPVAVCLDGDAWQEGWALAMHLRFVGARAGSIRLPPTKDPDEVDPEWLELEAYQCLDG